MSNVALNVRGNDSAFRALIVKLMVQDEVRPNVFWLKHLMSGKNYKGPAFLVFAKHAAILVDQSHRHFRGTRRNAFDYAATCRTVSYQRRKQSSASGIGPA